MSKIGESLSNTPPVVDKLSVRTADNLADIEKVLNSTDKVFFMIDLRHVGVSNNTTFLEVVDDHITAFDSIFKDAFANAGIPFHLARVGGDEFMGFFPQTDEAMKTFNQVLKDIEVARNDHFEGNPSIQESGLLQQTAVRSFARSFLKRCQEATGQTPTIDELWEATQQEAMANKHETVTEASREAYGNISARSQNAEFYKALLLAVLHRQITEADLDARDFESRYEDKPLSLSVVAINTDRPLSPELMGQLATQAEDELGREKKATTPLYSDVLNPDLKIKVQPFNPSTPINDEWTEETRRAEALQEKLAEVDTMADLSGDDKNNLKQYLRALDPSLSLELPSREPLRAVLIDEISTWSLGRLMRIETIPYLSAITLDIDGFGAINNHYGYQIADKLLHDVVKQCLDTLYPGLQGSVQIQLVRQGGGKVHILIGFENQSHQTDFEGQYQENQADLSQNLADQLALYYQTPAVLAEITQKMVTSILSFDEEKFLANLTAEYQPPSVALNRVSTESLRSHTPLGSWLTPPTPAENLPYK